MLIGSFVSSIYLDNLSLDFQTEVMQVADELPDKKKDQIIESAFDFAKTSGILSTIIQTMGIFIVMPFGLLIKLRYFD